MRVILLAAGDQFGRLTVTKRAPNRHRGKVYWLCTCSCGTECTVSSTKLRSGYTRSCGCLRFDTVPATTHGHSSRGVITGEYRAWRSMKARCSLPSQRSYPHYGARGISVCAAWKESFENFLADLGPMPSPSHSIERIDVNGNYEPSNCVWILRSDQGKNTRKTVRVTYQGQSMCLADAARESGLSYMKLYKRIQRGRVTEPELFRR